MFWLRNKKNIVQICFLIWSHVISWNLVLSIDISIAHFYRLTEIICLSIIHLNPQLQYYISFLRFVLASAIHNQSQKVILYLNKAGVDGF